MSKAPQYQLVKNAGIWSLPPGQSLLSVSSGLAVALGEAPAAVTQVAVALEAVAPVVVAPVGEVLEAVAPVVVAPVGEVLEAVALVEASVGEVLEAVALEVALVEVPVGVVAEALVVLGAVAPVEAPVEVVGEARVEVAAVVALVGVGAQRLYERLNAPWQSPLFFPLSVHRNSSQWIVCNRWLPAAAFLPGGNCRLHAIRQEQAAMY